MPNSPQSMVVCISVALIRDYMLIANVRLKGGDLASTATSSYLYDLSCHTTLPRILGIGTLCPSLQLDWAQIC